jgi:KipI family sensor histidine kinase inhibitor
VSEAEIVRLHSEPLYRVSFLGFLPGFAYLRGLAPQLQTPRLASARAHVPAGSVGIGEGQTGVYPIDSPGGWRLIGRTPKVVFDLAREPAALFAPGDRVRFRPITFDVFRQEGGKWGS